jgi:hypothetical protein
MAEQGFELPGLDDGRIEQHMIWRKSLGLRVRAANPRDFGQELEGFGPSFLSPRRSLSPTSERV